MNHGVRRQLFYQREIKGFLFKLQLYKLLYDMDKQKHYEKVKIVNYGTDASSNIANI